MTAAVEPPPAERTREQSRGTPEREGHVPFDPDSFRMTIGEHLEELRSRLIRSLLGFAVALVICLVFYKDVVWFFVAPLVKELLASDINPQLVVDELGEGFMVVVRIAVICAAAIASPWALYQLWQFVAAGLYPHERKYITRYLPLSLALLTAGMAFVYLLVLPWTLQFFIGFNLDLPLKIDEIKHLAPQPTTAPAHTPTVQVPAYAGDPATPRELQIWFDTTRQQLKLFYGSQVRVISFNSPNLVAQEYKLSHYMSLVVMMLVTFGLSFQLPLAVLALERIGIVDLEGLRAARRYVYFAMVVAAAVITPGDVVTATVALMFPLIGLYELGILLARVGKPAERK